MPSAPQVLKQPAPTRCSALSIGCFGARDRPAMCGCLLPCSPRQSRRHIPRGSALNQLSEASDGERCAPLRNENEGPFGLALQCPQRPQFTSLSSRKVTLSHHLPRIKRQWDRSSFLPNSDQIIKSKSPAADRNALATPTAGAIVASLMPGATVPPSQKRKRSGISSRFTAPAIHPQQSETYICHDLPRIKQFRSK